jgi:EpsI family protein
VTHLRWAPAALLGAGALFTVGVDTQRTMALREPLGATVPARIAGFQATDLTLTDDERRAAGVTDYLVRSYGGGAPADSAAFSVYVGYYDRQTQGRTIHSPKNCLPGSGWEALASEAVRIQTTAGAVVVNRYLIRKGSQRALVLYWYQGRGRVASNEYRVKWNLLRDAALRRRTEEALVRIVVPVADREEPAFDLGARAVQALIPAVARALPG